MMKWFDNFRDFRALKDFYVPFYNDLWKHLKWLFFTILLSAAVLLQCTTKPVNKNIKMKLWTSSRIHVPFWSVWGQLNPYDFELVFLGLSLIGETFKACGR